MTKEYYSELARRATTDEEAFEELYEYFFPRVYNFIFARLKNVADADDVTSVTFMKMNENLESYDPNKAAFSTWLFRIANNALIDHTRRHENKNETEWDDLLDPAAPEREEPEAVMMSGETNRELLAALSKLNERERRIVELYNQQPQSANPAVLSYINRLSDYLFVLSRHLVVAQGQEEIFL